MQLCLGRGDESETTLQEQVRAAAEAGFHCLDLSLPALDDYSASYPSIVLVTLLQQHELHVGMVSGLPPLAPDEPLLLLRARLMALCADLDALGGGTVLLPMPLAPSAGEAHPSILERALRALADVAAPFDVRLAVIPRLGQGDAGPVLTDAAALVDRIRRPNLGLGLDLAGGHVPAEIPAVFSQVLWAVRVGAAVWEEEKASQLRALCTQLASAGYRGPYSVAPAPAASTLAEGARLAKEALQALGVCGDP